uniref:T9SS type B sorting domain-containing protein n=1 Tax=Flavobacterium sp. TaxID=239 RepID=UPI0040492261
MKQLKFLLAIFFLSSSAFAQQGAFSCAELEANFQLYQSCATNIPFTNSTGGNGEVFNSTCIPTQFVGPTWFFIEVKDPGTITLRISQTDMGGGGTDVDFILWGPFNNLNNICGRLNVSTEIDCSYSPASIEDVIIPASTTGQLYVLLIDNFSGTPGNISVTQTGGTGTTNCDFLSNVKIKNTDTTEITQFEYCKPATKDIMATIDVTAFPGNIADLRFNYTWYKDNVQIGSPILNSTLPTNTITTTETGIYKVIITAYDIVNNPSQNSPPPTPSEAEVDLKFHAEPTVTIQNTNTTCLNTNPVLNATITNNASLNNLVDILTYQWYRNNTFIPRATNSSYTPLQPGDYFVRVFNSPCATVDSNIIRIIASPNVSITNNQTICEGSSYTITSTNANTINNIAVTYEWFKDGVTTGITTADYTVNASNQALNTTATYYVVTTEQGTCSQTSNSVNITVNALPIINTTPIILEQCDFIPSTIDGIAETNLTQLYNYITNNTAGLTLYYYEDIGLTIPILNPINYVNTISPFTQTIYVKAINENVVPNCPSIGTGVINLQINPTSVANYPNITPVCPEINTNFGFIDFDAQRVLIKNTFFPSSPVDISFFLSPSDASSETNPLSNSSQITIGTSTIYTRIETNNNCGGIGTFEITITTPPIQNVITNENICLLDTFLLNSKDSEALLGQNPTVIASYFNSFSNAELNISAINKTIPLPITLGVNTYYIRLFDTATQCFSIVNFDIEVFPNPTIFQPNPIELCGTTTADFNLNSRINQITGGNTNYQVVFYASNADLLAGNSITNTSNYNSAATIIYIQVIDPTNNGCAAETTLDLIVLSLPGATINPTDIEQCNDSGFDSFNLRMRETEMAGSNLVSDINFKYYELLSDALLNNSNTIINPNSFINTIINYQKIFVRLNSLTNRDSESGEQCFRILEIELYVRPYPASNLLEIPYTICVDQATNTIYPVEIKTLLDATNYSFEWYTGFAGQVGSEIAGENNSSFITDVVGEYSVKITNISNAANCSSVFNFTTQNSLVPNAITANPSELIAFGIDNTITASAIPASSDYLYSIDGFTWQENNVFTNIREGEYTLTVLNKFGCGQASTSIVVADFPPFFTPNGDGYNDTWNIKGSNALDFISIQIFDRYGKLVKQLDPNGAGWDGTYNGEQLPSSDYWFKLIYTKDNISKEFKSHFSLKR